MNSIEPEESVTATWTTVADVAKWAGFDTGNILHVTARDSFLAHLGMDLNTHLRILAAIPESDLQQYVSEWVNPGGGAPTPAMRASAGLMGRAARIAAGIQLRVQDIRRNAELVLLAQTRTPENAPDVERPQNTKSNVPTIKLSNCIDQSSDHETSPLSQEEIDKAYKRYDMGGGVPNGRS